jgi:hypothetical protein
MLSVPAISSFFLLLLVGGTVSHKLSGQLQKAKSQKQTTKPTLSPLDSSGTISIYLISFLFLLLAALIFICQGNQSCFQPLTGRQRILFW